MINTNDRKARKMEKANYLFIVYEQMGPDRTLIKLAELCGSLGVRISLSTLEQYSVQFEWQKRLLSKAIAIKEKTEHDSLLQVDRMNDRHAQFSQGMLALAAGMMRKYQNDLTQKKADLAALGKTNEAPWLDGTVQDMIALFNAAQRGERLARGEATDRSEVVVEVIGTFVQEFALIFLAVNDIADPQKRREEYITKADEMLKAYYSQATSKSIKQLGGKQ